MTVERDVVGVVVAGWTVRRKASRDNYLERSATVARQGGCSYVKAACLPSRVWSWFLGTTRAKSQGLVSRLGGVSLAAKRVGVERAPRNACETPTCHALPCSWNQRRWQAHDGGSPFLDEDEWSFGCFEAVRWGVIADQSPNATVLMAQSLAKILRDRSFVNALKEGYIVKQLQYDMNVRDAGSVGVPDTVCMHGSQDCPTAVPPWRRRLRFHEHYEQTQLLFVTAHGSPSWQEIVSRMEYTCEASIAAIAALHFLTCSRCHDLPTCTHQQDNRHGPANSISLQPSCHTSS